MDYDPSKTAAYLQGRIDEYVKFSARDTIMRNVRNDRHARYARVPDGGACDFCKMLGSRGFVYHSEDKAGGDSFHGTSMDSYHPFCNCQIAVCFDPCTEEYRKNGVHVSRGYGDGQVTVPGRDKSDVLRDVDIDELFEQYKSMTAGFGRGSSKYRDYSRAGFLAPEAMDIARKLLNDATSMDELMAADAEIMRMWPKGRNGRDRSQFDELRKLAIERKTTISASLLKSSGQDDRIVQEPKRLSKGKQSMRTPNVKFDEIDSMNYRKAFDFFDDTALGDVTCNAARDMLRHRSGSLMEDFTVISVSSKTTVTKMTSSSKPKQVVLSRENIRAIDGAKRGDLISVHNHPENMPPSFKDFLLVSHRAFRYGLIACHDGRVLRYRISDTDKFNEIVESGRGDEMDSFIRRNLVYYESKERSDVLVKALERRYGVTYEELT